MEQAVVFEGQRRRLFGIAYGIVRNAPDAEDVVQEAALRWLATDTAQVRSPEAWLVTTTQRLAIDSVRRATTERRVFERSPGEPPATVAQAADGAGESEAVADACRALLERLGPEERVAFVLRDVFDAGYGEVARALDKSEVACRQAVHRARQRIRAARPRTPVARLAAAAQVGSCVEALSAGARGDLLAILRAPDRRELELPSALDRNGKPEREVEACMR